MNDNYLALNVIFATYKVAVLYKKRVIESSKLCVFVPNKVIFGKLDLSNDTFVDNNGVVNYDIFYCRNSISCEYAYSKVMDFEEYVNSINTLDDSIIYYSRGSMIATHATKEQFKKDYGKDLPKDFFDVEKTLPKIDEVLLSVKESIVAQDDAIKDILIAFYNHINNPSDATMKANILLIGPTGVGKTEIIRQITSYLNLNFFSFDMTKFTPEGYRGTSVEEILKTILMRFDGDVDKATNSVIFLDELDKLLIGGSELSEFRKSVLQSLLIITAGGVVNVDFNGKLIPFDTSRLIIVGAGTFSTIMNKKYDENIKRERFGFELYDIVSKEMGKEFMGRINLIVPLNSLDIYDLITILKKSKLSPLNSYFKLFNEKNINCTTLKNIEFYRCIAKQSMQLNIGARGLTNVVNSMFYPIMYEVYSANSIEFVLENNKYIAAINARDGILQYINICEF